MVLSTDWAWYPAVAASGDEEDTSSSSNALLGPKVMLEIILGRCADSAPTVRTRAITAVADLLATLDSATRSAKDKDLLDVSYSSLRNKMITSHQRSVLSALPPPAMIQCLMQYALGEKAVYRVGGIQSSGLATPHSRDNCVGADSSINSVDNREKSICILDVLRNRCADERPLVRAKALQAFSLALTMSWLKLTPSLTPLPVDGRTPHSLYHKRARIAVLSRVDEDGDVENVEGEDGGSDDRVKRTIGAEGTHVRAEADEGDAPRSKRVASEKAIKALRGVTLAGDNSDTDEYNTDTDEDGNNDTEIETSKTQKATSNKISKDDSAFENLFVGFDLSKSHMLVSDEDVTVFVDSCGDSSVAVRKQAVACLSDLLAARPSDRMLLEAWVIAALPLAADSESSVQLKLAQCVYELLFVGIGSWGEQSSRGKAISTVDSNSSHYALWELSAMISSTPVRAKLLRSVVGVLVRQNIFSNTNSGITLKKIMKSIKSACCITLVQTQASELDRDVCSDNTSNEDQAVAISKAGWVLLEAVMTQEVPGADTLSRSSGATSSRGNVLTEALRNATKTKAGCSTDGTSADFVVQCWLQKRAFRNIPGSSTTSPSRKNNQFQFDDDDIRMLRVLDKLAIDVSSEDRKKVIKELVKILSALKCDPHGASTAVMCLFSLSTVSSPSEIVTSKQSIVDSKACVHSYGIVQTWAATLLDKAYGVLYEDVWGTEPTSQQKGTLFTTANRVSSSPNVTETHIKGSSVIKRQFSKQEVATALFLVGEISMLGFSVEEEDSRFSMAHPHPGLDTDLDTTDDFGVSPTSVPNYSVANPSGTFKLHIPQQLVGLVQILMALEYPNSFKRVSGASIGGSSVCNSSSIAEAECKRFIPNTLRAHAFVALGKLSLRNRTLARDHINVYLRELHSNNADTATNESAMLDTSTSVEGTANVVKSNALLVLGDLCVRYTNLVDRHIGSLATCLQDSDVLVRRHALVLLTQLVLQDYLKWRGLLLFRFLATSVDSDAEISEISKNILKKTLTTKFPSDFYCSHFSESILVFNGCTNHPLYAAIAALGSEGESSSAVTMEGVNLTGPQNRNKRLRVYALMMESFTEEQKIMATAKLVADVLSHAVDSQALRDSRTLQDSGASSSSSTGATALPSPFEQAIADALLILQSPLLKVGRISANNGLDEDLDLQQDDAAGPKDRGPGGANASVLADGGKAAVAKAKATVLKKVSRQHMIEQVLPVVCSLKHTLESLRSPLQRPLMEYLVYLVKGNKVEVAQALSSDPTLKAEIDYDLKMFERERQERALSQTNSVDVEGSHGRMNGYPTPHSAHGNPHSAATSGRKIVRLSVGSVSKSTDQSINAQISSLSTGLSAMKASVSNGDHQIGSEGGKGSTSKSIPHASSSALRKSLGHFKIFYLFNYLLSIRLDYSFLSFGLV